MSIPQAALDADYGPPPPGSDERCANCMYYKQGTCIAFGQPFQARADYWCEAWAESTTGVRMGQLTPDEQMAVNGLLRAIQSGGR